MYEFLDEVPRKYHKVDFSREGGATKNRKSKEKRPPSSWRTSFPPSAPMGCTIPSLIWIFLPTLSLLPRRDIATCT